MQAAVCPKTERETLIDFLHAVTWSKSSFDVNMAAANALGDLGVRGYAEPDE